MKIKLTKIRFLHRKRALQIFMRLFILLFCTTVFSLNTEISLAQEKVVINEDKDATVDQVFQMIMFQTKYNFLYPEDLFKDMPKVKLRKGIIRVDKLLSQSISKGNFDIIVMADNTIVIKEPNSQNQRQVKGKVVDEKGLPVAGAAVIIKGTSKGVVTDFDGGYSILVGNPENVLVFSYLGFHSQEITVGSQTTINVTLKESISGLEEVVVTALGIKQERKALGYAVSSVESGAVEDRTEGDLARILSGKVPGLEITNSSGFSGSGTNVIIRGFTSFTGDNQALFVVDGVPYNNDVNLDIFNNGFLNSNETTNRAFDIDPNNIESVEILKGLAASTLYGARGVNGVILITTKTGSNKNKLKRPTLDIAQSTIINTMSTIPDYQNEYGQGDNGVFNPTSFNSWGPSFKKDGPNGYGLDPNIDDNGTYLHPLSGNPNFPEFDGARLPYSPVGDRNFKNFFSDGLTTITSINFKGNSTDGNTSFNSNFGHLNDKSFVPGNGVTRTNISIGGSTKILDKLTLEASGTFTTTNQKSPNTTYDFTGFGRSNIVSNTLALSRSYDLFALPYVDPVTNESLFFTTNVTNPRWLAENNSNSRLTNRNNWRVELNYQFNDNISLSWRTGRDFYITDQEERTNRDGPIAVLNGSLSIGKIQGSIWDHLLTFQGKHNFNNKISLNATVGANARRNEIKFSTFTTSNQQILNNFLPENFDPDNDWTDNAFSNSDQNQVGVFGQFTVGYDDFVFLNGSVRSDWVSNLKSGYNNATYPSLSVSFLPTSAFKSLQSVNGNGLNYLKLRGSYGESTRFAGGYPTDFNVSIGSNTALGISTQRVSGAIDAGFVPETVREYEIGMETRFLKNRGFLDVSLWKRRTEDIQEILTEIPPSTGQNSFFTNNGIIEAEGIEIDLSYILVDNKSFSWKSRINFSSHNEILVERSQDFQAFGRSIFTFGSLNNIGINAAIPGESLGTIVGSRAKRNADGVPIIGSNGYYISELVDEDGKRIVVGDAIPDFRMNYINTLTYKGFSLNILVQHVKGGDLYTPVPAFLLGRGLIKDNLDAHGNTIIIDGVTESGEPNTVPITPEQYYRQNRGFNVTEFNIYDASVIRLQELSLTYNIPNHLLKNTPFSKLGITFQGNNLWHSAYNIPKGTNLDPNVSGPGVGNNRGIDYSNNAGSRRYGLTLRASF